MSTKTEVHDFLVSRRARLKPAEAGLRVASGRRRVPGLRREELAMLAGVSIDYYVQLERGDISGASDGVLDSLAKALHLDDAERDHLFALARASRTTPVRRRPAPQTVRRNVQLFLDTITGAPAWIQNDRLDILATNALGRALHAPMFDIQAEPVNSARFAFLDRRGPDFFLDWNQTADDFVAVLRGAAGKNPYDKKLTALVGELATRSDDFRVRWAAHDVRSHGTGRKRIRHPEVGDLDLMYEGMDLVAEPGLTMATYTAEPGSVTEDALRLLGSWNAPDRHALTGAQEAGASS